MARIVSMLFVAALLAFGCNEKDEEMATGGTAAKAVPAGAAKLFAHRDDVRKVRCTAQPRKVNAIHRHYLPIDFIGEAATAACVAELVNGRFVDVLKIEGSWGHAAGGSQERTAWDAGAGTPRSDLERPHGGDIERAYRLEGTLIVRPEELSAGDHLGIAIRTWVRGSCNSDWASTSSAEPTDAGET